MLATHQPVQPAQGRSSYAHISHLTLFKSHRTHQILRHLEPHQTLPHLDFTTLDSYQLARHLVPPHRTSPNTCINLLLGTTASEDPSTADAFFPHTCIFLDPVPHRQCRPKGFPWKFSERTPLLLFAGLGEQVQSRRQALTRGDISELDLHRASLSILTYSPSHHSPSWHHKYDSLVRLQHARLSASTSSTPPPWTILSTRPCLGV